MADQDTIEFDPYYKWLGIPPADQPADHYRLLGLRLFEEDREVIAIAADRQMSHIKSFGAGKYSHQSQALLGELARAKLCLLNTARKATYDAKLLEKIAPVEEAASGEANAPPWETSQSVPDSRPYEEPIARPAEMPAPIDEVSINFDSLDEFRIPRKNKPQHSEVFIWYLLTVSLAVLGFAIIRLSSCQEPPNTSPKTERREPVPIESALVSVIPTINGDGFLAELSRPIGSDAEVSYVLSVELASGKKFQKESVFRIRAGEVLSNPVSIAGLVKAEIKLLPIIGQSALKLDPAKSMAVIDNTQRPDEHQEQDKEQEQDEQDQDEEQEQLEEQEQPPPPPPPPAPFAETPATIDLPEISDDRVTPLFAVPEGVSFELIPSVSSLVLVGDRLEWGDDERQLIGGLVVSDGQLHFRWINDVPAEAEIALRNSLIKLAVGEEVHVVALRTPVAGEAFRFDLSTPAQRILCKCDHMPDARKIRFSFTTPKDLPSLDLDPLPEKGLQYPGILSLAFLEADTVKTRFDMERIGNVLSVKVERKFKLPSSDIINLTFKKLKDAQNTIASELGEIDYEIDSLNQLLKKPPESQRAAIQATLKWLDGERKTVLADQVELNRVVKLAEQLHDKELFYRFFTVVDEYEVDLVVGKAMSK